MTALNQEQAQRICDKWVNLFKIGSWKFTVELKDNGPVQFRYNTQNGAAILEITYEAANEETVVSMLVDFAIIHQLLPRLLESGEQYLDHDDRNIKEVVGALLKLAHIQEENQDGQKTD